MYGRRVKALPVSTMCRAFKNWSRDCVPSTKPPSHSLQIGQ